MLQAVAAEERAIPAIGEEDAVLYPTGAHRYRLTRLSDGRIHAADTVDARRAYLLTPRPATRQTYQLARAGELQVRAGHVAGLSEPAASSGYGATRGRDGAIHFTKVGDARWELVVSPRFGTTAPRGRFAVLDLRDGTLLLLDRLGVRELAVAPVFAAPAAHPARPAPVARDPDFELSDDFAP